MNRLLLAASLCLVGLTGLIADAGATGQDSQQETTPQPAEIDEARLKADRDARFERMQAENAAAIAARRAEQERYEQGVRDAEIARIQHEAAMARHREEVERARQAEAEYQRQLADHTNRTSSSRRSAATDRQSGSAGSGPTSAKDCEQRRDRNRRRGQVLGGLLGGIAAGLATGLSDRPPEEVAGAVAVAVPVGALLGDAIAARLDCEEQQQAAVATERAVAGGVGTTIDWTSETRPGVSGSSTVLALETEADGAECLTVTDVVIIEGEETRVPKRMCRRPGSTRFVRV